MTGRSYAILLVLFVIIYTIQFSLIRLNPVQYTSESNLSISTNNHPEAYKCPLTNDKWIVLTTVNYPTNTVRLLAAIGGWSVLIVADTKTPIDWFRNDTDLNVTLLTVREQTNLNFALASVLKFNSYERKNLGYLCAIQCGARWIYETDDDNTLVNLTWFTVVAQTDAILEAIPPITSKATLLNPYAQFGRPDIWPRGFPLSAIKDLDSNEFYNVRQALTPVRPWIQQALADLDPDVDAIYRLTQPPMVGTVRFRPWPQALAVPNGMFSPYNTQNTFYSQEAFWGLLLPATTTFRVCDIWRGYWVQRLLWEVSGTLIFRPALVEQRRNWHNLKDDFAQEHQLDREQIGEFQDHG